jgi:hypothetical protein
MTDLIALIALLIVIGYQGWFIWRLQEEHEKMQKDLLNRLMARNFETFVQSEIQQKENVRPLTAEEIYEMEMNKGVPI